MVNPFEETRQAGIINPNEVDALAKQRYDWNRANTEFSRFHAKSDPTAQMYEQGAYERRGNPEFVNARSPRVFENTQWSPNYPGPKFDTRFIVGSSGSSSGLNSMNRRDYYDQMKGSEQNWMDILKGDVRQRLGISNEPGINAGITNPNLGGYRVMNASDPTGNDGWIDRLGRWLFNDPYDKESDESLYQGTEQDKLESEYGTEGTGEFYPDKILRDLYPQALGEQSPYTSDQELNNFFEGLDSEDLGVEPQLEASVAPDDWRTIIKILEAGGNPDDYINVRHDMGDDVEEEGGGWLSNPLMKELRRRNMERGRKQMMEDTYRRMMEQNQRLQMDMLMNRNKFNTVPGTGDINPIFGDQYWNI